MAGLRLTTAARIAAREMRSSRAKFFFVILSVAVGVAALTGVRGFSSEFRATLLTRARSILAADLAARTNQQPSESEQAGLADIEAAGVKMTPVTELLSMASSPKTMDPLLISLKAVDPTQYPFYGQVELDPAAPLASVLNRDTVVVADDLLVRLHLQVGDGLKIGEKIYRIAGVVVNEPDRLSGSFAAGPRVLMSQEGLADSGLIAPGSHAGQRFLFKMPPAPRGAPVSDEAVAALKARLIRLLPESQVTNYRETNPALTAGLDQATSLLSLMSLVALVLGAVGVAMAMRAHLQQRLDTIAIMKSLGARSGQILRIYLLQTLLLGLLGGLLGVVLGIGVQLLFPYLLASLINIRPEWHLEWRSVATGLTAGVLTTVLFTLPPLLDIRSVRPILILRRAVEDEDEPALRKLVRTLRNNPAQLVAWVAILGTLAVLALRVSDSRTVGGWFAAGLVAVLLALLGASAALLAGLKLLLARTRLRLPSVLRHGLANLYRPGNPSAALLAALGMGVMQITTVLLMQHAVVQQLHLTSAPDLPNIFLIDVANSEVAGVRTLLEHSPVVTAKPELLPVVSARIVAIDGVPAAEIRTKNFPRHMLRSIQLTYTEGPPPGTEVTHGAWWTAAEARAASDHPVVEVAEQQAERLGVQVGSTIRFGSGDREIEATVAGLMRSNGQHAYSRAGFILPPDALRGLPVIWYGGVHADPARVGELQRALYAAYPTVTVINVAQALETIRAVVVQIIYVVQFLAAFSIFAGVVILASAIAGTRYRRIREVVVLKTLGATRSRIAQVFSVEFAVLGLVAGVVGVVFAGVVVHFLLRALHVPATTQWGRGVLAVLLTSVLTVATGWLASFRVLGQKPLEVLREE